MHSAALRDPVLDAVRERRARIERRCGGRGPRAARLREQDGAGGGEAGERERVERAAEEPRELAVEVECGRDKRVEEYDAGLCVLC